MVSPWMGRKAAKAAFLIALGLIVLTQSSTIVEELSVWYPGERGLDFVKILLLVLAIWFFVDAGLSLYEGHKGPPVTDLHVRVQRLEKAFAATAPPVASEAAAPPPPLEAPPPPPAAEEPPPPPSEA